MLENISSSGDYGSFLKKHPKSWQEIFMSLSEEEKEVFLRLPREVQSVIINCSSEERSSYLHFIRRQEISDNAYYLNTVSLEECSREDFKWKDFDFYPEGLQNDCEDLGSYDDSQRDEILLSGAFTYA